MSLPIRVFWLMNSNATRIMAEKDLRSMVVLAGSQSGESAEKVRKDLVIEMGSVGEVEGSPPINAERDREGFDELKQLAAMM